MDHTTPESIEEIIEEEEENRTYSSIDDANQANEKLFPTNSYVDENISGTINEVKKSIYSSKEPDAVNIMEESSIRKKLNKTASADFIKNKSNISSGRLKRSRIVSENDKQKLKEAQEVYISERIEGESKNDDIVFFREQQPMNKMFKISHFTKDEMTNITSSIQQGKQSIDSDGIPRIVPKRQNIFEIVKRKLKSGSTSPKQIVLGNPRHTNFSLNNSYGNNQTKDNYNQLDELSMEEFDDHQSKKRRESATTTKKELKGGNLNQNTLENIEKVDTKLPNDGEYGTFDRFKFEKESSDINLTLDEEENKEIKNEQGNHKLSLFKNNKKLLSLDEISNFCKKFDSKSGANVNNINVFNNIDNSVIHVGKEPPLSIQPRPIQSIRVNPPTLTTLKTHSQASPDFNTLKQKTSKENNEKISNLDDFEINNNPNESSKEDVEQEKNNNEIEWKGEISEKIIYTEDEGSDTSELPFLAKTLDSEDLSESRNRELSQSKSQLISSKSIVQKNSHFATNFTKQQKKILKRVTLKESLRKQVKNNMRDSGLIKKSEGNIKKHPKSFYDSKYYKQEYVLKERPRKWLKRGNSHTTKLKMPRNFESRRKTSSSMSPAKLRFQKNFQSNYKAEHNRFLVKSTKNKIQRNAISENLTKKKFCSKKTKNEVCIGKCKHKPKCVKTLKNQCANFSTYSKSNEPKKKKKKKGYKPSETLSSQNTDNEKSFAKTGNRAYSHFRSDKNEPSSNTSSHMSSQLQNKKDNEINESLLIEEDYNKKRKEINLNSILSNIQNKKHVHSSKKHIKNANTSLKRFQSVQNNSIPPPISKTYNDYGIQQKKRKTEEKLKRKHLGRIQSITSSLKTKPRRCSHNTNLTKTFQVLSNQSKKELTRLRKKHTFSLKNSFVMDKSKIKKDEKGNLAKGSKFRKQKNNDGKKLGTNTSGYDTGKFTLDNFLKMKSNLMFKNT